MIPVRRASGPNGQPSAPRAGLELATYGLGNRSDMSSGSILLTFSIGVLTYAAGYPNLSKPASIVGPLLRACGWSLVAGVAISRGACSEHRRPHILRVWRESVAAIGSTVTYSGMP